MRADLSGTRLEKWLDRWAWVAAGFIAGSGVLLYILAPKEPTSPGLLGQIGLQVFYFMFVLVLPLAAVAGAVTPLWCISRRGGRAFPRIHRVLISILAAGVWYWFLQAHIVELS